jgi:hypothetical protein
MDADDPHRGVKYFWGSFCMRLNAEARQQKRGCLGAHPISIDVQPADLQMGLTAAQIKVQPWISYADSFTAAITIQMKLRELEGWSNLLYGAAG